MTARPKNRTGIVQGRTKLMLKNIIRHTDTHNRLIEEAEMWRAYSKMKNSNGDDLNPHDGRKRPKDGERDQHVCNFNDPDVRNSFLYDDRQVVRGRYSTKGHSSSRAHMDSYDDDGPSDASPGGSTYWMRQLEKAEAADDDRWGHAGYKELYPQDFQSDKSVSSSSSQEESDSDRSFLRKKKKRKSSELSSTEKKSVKKKKKKRDKRKKSDRKKSSGKYERHEAKKTLKRKRKRADEDRESETDSRQRKQLVKDKKEFHRKKRRK